MLIKELMTVPAVTVTPGTSIKEALRLLDERRVTSLPVTDSQGRILGVVSEADLLRGAVRHDPRTQMLPRDDLEEHPSRVDDVMSTLSMTVGVDGDLNDAVELMTSTAVKSLPVLDRGRVVGMISRSDVVHLLARADEQIRGEVDNLLRGAGLECEVEVVDGIVTLDSFEDPAHWRIADVLAGSVAGVISVQPRR